jgi:hypothetical protein
LVKAPLTLKREGRYNADLKEIYDFIDTELELAAASLPESSSNDIGRITVGPHWA